MTKDNQDTSNVSPLTSHVEDDEINLLDYYRVLVKHKKLIGKIVGSAFVLSIIVSLLLPKIYSATASILPPQREGSVSSAILSQLPGGLGGLAGGLMGGGSPSELWVGILGSRTVADAIIERFNLKEIYNSETAEGVRGETLDVS